MAKGRPGSGDFTEYVQFLKMPAPSEQDTMGAPSSTPQHHFYSYAAFQPVGSDEFPSSEKRWSETTARFIIPYQTIVIDAGTHTIRMTFDSWSSPPNVSTWNVLGAYGDRFETTIEANEIK